MIARASHGLTWLCSSALLAALLAACGGGGDQPDGGGGEGRYLPFAQGATWTYRITDPMTGATENKTSTVGALEDVGGTKAGVMAFKVTTERLDGNTISWQEDTGTAVIRHKEESYDAAAVLTRTEIYDPYKLRLDEDPARLTQGATYDDAYTENATDATGPLAPVVKTETWTIEAVDEQVTVPAGTFTCIRVHRSSSAVGTAAKTYWFARGVGKVKELGGQTEELTAYSLP